MQKQEGGHMFLEERKEEIMRMLTKKQKLLVTDLCEHFGVSSATIRNDLNELESRGLLIRTHGGAMLGTKIGFEQNSIQKEATNVVKKQAIAKLAAELVNDGDVIVVDTGTTAYAFAQEIKNKKNLTVVTNDLKIALLLEEESDANIVLVGGTIRHKFHCAVGPLATEGLKNFRVDKCFMGTNGLTEECGLTTPDIQQAEVKRQMVLIGTQVIVLCDSSKIGVNSFCSVIPLNKVDVLVTDSGINEQMQEQLEQSDITVHVCKVNSEINKDSFKRTVEGTPNVKIKEE